MTDNQFEAKEWLNRMQYMNEEIDALKRTLETIVADMGGVSKYDQDFRANNPRASEEKLLRYSQVRAELEKKENNLAYENRRTGEIIEKLNNPRYKALLRDKYINNLSWKQISRLKHYSETRIYELHRLALEEIWQYIPGKNGNV